MWQASFIFLLQDAQREIFNKSISSLQLSYNNSSFKNRTKINHKGSIWHKVVAVMSAYEWYIFVVGLNNVLT